ncbi:Dolichyl-diphosphooligosaccharide-protein glycosyltransferase subunit dad1 [Botryosphaeria dothidea]
MPGGNNSSGEKTYFEQQREMLVGEVAQNLEAVLQNINKLNRSLEGVIAVGNEFGSVEALWSQFENVMARDPNAAPAEGQGEGEHGEEDTTVLQEEKP